MPALKNGKHELFAQALAKGKSQTEAYSDAGYNPSRSAAARLAADVNICARVAELQNRIAARTEVTVANITERLLKIADVAEKTGITVDGETGEAKVSSSKHLTVARAALMDAAKLNGLVVEKQDHSSSDGSMSPKPTVIEFRSPDVADEGDG
ncbi:MAG: terminase small subunit [Caulobacter sp.]